MSKLFQTPINLAQNELQNGVIQNLSSAPSSPKAGQVYWDTTQNQMFYWNATAGQWQWVATNSLLLQGQNGAYYLARANQTGTQLAATISNLQATVIAYTLDTFAAPIAAVNINGQRLTNVGTPTLSTDAANKAYVDSVAQGLSPKPSAMVATTAALPANTYSNGTSGVGATLVATANGVLTVDAYSPALNDGVLVKNEPTAANNGLYRLTTLGTSSAPWVLTRDVDMDQTNEFGGGFIAVKDSGTTNKNSLWLCEAAATITVGTTAVNFTQLNAATVITGSNGVQVVGNNASGVVVAGGGVLVGASGFQLDTSVAVRKFAANVGDGSTLSYSLTHGLGTQDITVAVYSNTTPFAEIECDVGHTTTNSVTLTFATAPTSGQYRAVVHG